MINQPDIDSPIHVDRTQVPPHGFPRRSLNGFGAWRQTRRGPQGHLWRARVAICQESPSGCAAWYFNLFLVDQWPFFSEHLANVYSWHQFATEQHHVIKTNYFALFNRKQSQWPCNRKRFIGGTVPTICKAFFHGLCMGISPQNIALYGVVPPFKDPEIPIQ